MWASWSPLGTILGAQLVMPYRHSPAFHGPLPTRNYSTGERVPEKPNSGCGRKPAHMTGNSQVLYDPEPFNEYFGYLTYVTARFGPRSVTEAISNKGEDTALALAIDYSVDYSVELKLSICTSYCSLPQPPTEVINQRRAIERGN